MPKNRNVQFSPHAPETHTFERERVPVDDRPASAAIRQASSNMIDDVFSAVMLAANADDNTLSLALCRTSTEYNSRKAQLMQVRLDEMVLRKHVSENQKRAAQLDELVAKRNTTPPTQKFLRKNRGKPQKNLSDAQRITVPTPSRMEPREVEYDDPLLPAKSEEERLRAIRKKKREVARLKKLNADAEALKLEKWREESKAFEDAQRKKKEDQAQARKQALIEKRQKRLEKVAEMERQREAILQDNSAAKYQREQAMRAKRQHDDYVKRVEMPQLEQRKKLLADLRQQFDPMDHEALRRREREYLMEMSADRLSGKEQRKIELELNQLTAGRHHGQFLQRAQEELQRQRREHKEKEDAKLQRLQRRRRYAELAQEMFAPAVDEDKKREVEERAAQPCHGWGWKECPPQRKRSVKPRDKQSLDGSPRAALIPEYTSQESLVENQPQLDPLAVGDYPSSRLSEYTPRDTTPREPDPAPAMGDLETLAQDDGVVLTRLSQQPEGNNQLEEKLGELERGLQHQSAQSEGYLAAIKSQLDMIEGEEHSENTAPKPTAPARSEPAVSTTASSRAPSQSQLSHGSHAASRVASTAEEYEAEEEGDEEEDQANTGEEEYDEEYDEEEYGDEEEFEPDEEDEVTGVDGQAQ